MARAGNTYRTPKARELAAIEARRKAAGIAMHELAAKAGLSERTYRRMVKSGLGFKRRIMALAMALRTLEQDLKRETEVFPIRERTARPFVPPVGSPAGGARSANGSAPGSAAGRSRR